MTISINGNKKNYAALNISILHMLKEEKIEKPEGLAIAVNEEVISRTNWEKHLLKEGDEIIIIKATQGG